MRIIISLIALVAPAHAFDLDQLSRLVFDRPATSVEQLLPLLPSDLRARYVLMAHSRSLQEGTPENPRAILFNEDASTMISFNGGAPGMREADTMEVVQKRGDHYDFALFAFGKTQLPDDPFRSQGGVTEYRNPRICMGCHGGTDPRPNWEPFPEWPGAVPVAVRSTAEERQYLENFAASAPAHARYRYLDSRANLTDGASMAQQLDRLLEPGRRERLVKKLRASPDFGKFRFALLGAMVDCAGLEGFVPDASLFDKLMTRTQLTEAVRAEVSSRAPGHQLFFSYTPENAEIVGNLKWLLEPRGQKMFGWSSSFPSPSLFTTVPSEFFPLVVAELADGDVPLEAVRKMLLGPEEKEASLRQEDVEKQAAFCAGLKRKSLDALSAR